MSYSVRIMPPALEDIKLIASSAKSEKNSTLQMENLKAEIEKLKEFPDAFRLYKDEPWKSRGLRFFPVGKYLVFYILNEAENSVSVLRIIFGKMDLTEVLK